MLQGMASDPVYVMTTARCKLREIVLDSPQDQEFILQLWQDPTIIRNIGDRNIRTIEDSIRVIARMVNDYAQWGFGSWVVEYYPPTEEPSEAQLPVLIGIAGFLKRDYLPYPDAGWCFLEQFQRKGLGLEVTEAILAWYHNEYPRKFEFGPLSETATTESNDTTADKTYILCGFTSPTNEGSRRLLEKCGFVLQPQNLILPSQEVCVYYEQVFKC